MKNRLKHFIWKAANVFSYLFGFPVLAPLHHLVAFFALHALGYDNLYNENWTGEYWFIKNMLPTIGDAVCIDIGAHIGNYSAKLAEHVPGQIYAIEPLSSSFAVLEKRVGRIRPFRLAITDYDGTSSIFSHKERGVDATLNKGAMQGITIEEKIPVLTLDSFVAQNKLSNIGFIKIDTESNEREVLTGMQGLIKNNPPMFVQFEFNFGHLQRHNTLLSLTLLLPGYTFYRLLSHGMLQIQPDKYIDNLFMYSNIIAKRMS